MPQLTPDEAAASLAFATRLQENLLMPQEALMEEQGVPEEGMMDQPMEEPIEQPMSQPEENIDVKLNSLREEFRSMIQEEIGSLKETLKSVLEDDDEKGED